MSLKFFVLGFFVKIIASIDDTVTRIPLLLAITDTRLGKVAFAMGNLIAIGVAAALAWSFSGLLSDVPGFKWIVVGIFVLLAASIYFDWFAGRGMNVQKKIKRKKGISPRRVVELMFWGFVISLFTLLDDAVVFVPLFVGTTSESWWAVAGIFSSSFIQLALMIFFAEWLEKLPHRKLITVGGLLIFALLFALGVV